MKLALLVVANGRGDLLDQTMAAIDRYVRPAPSTTLVCDDSGDGGYLDGRYPGAEVAAHPHLGHGPAIRFAWRRAAELPVDWVLWMEEDMLFDREVDLRVVADVIRDEGLAQMVFLRNAHFPAEVEAGPTMIDRYPPETFEDRETKGSRWLRHRAFYSLNPHLVPVSFLRRYRWPPIPNSEHHFGRMLFRDPRVRVGLWGPRGSEPVVRHVGLERTGTGY